MHAHEYNAMFGSRQSILYPPLLVVKPILAALIGANMRAQNVSNCTSTEEPVPADLLRAGPMSGLQSRVKLQIAAGHPCKTAFATILF